MTVDRVDVPDLWTLPWHNLDPAGRPGFDPAGVAELVRELPPAVEIPPAGADWRLTSFWFDRMTEALVERLGKWVVGWDHTLAMEQYEDRGVIPIWRVKNLAVTTPAETLTSLADAVVAWHELLVELATDSHGRFAAAARPATDGNTDLPVWRAVQGPGRIILHNTDYMDRPHRPPRPWELSWADVDPAGRVFDPGTVPAVVTDLVADLPSAETDWRLTDVWLENVTAGLVDRYGHWAVGWQWAVGEGDLDGGPISSYCCFHHSATTPEITATNVAAALLEWHDWLTELAQTFDRFLPLPAGDLDGWERAVAHLVTAVGDRTQYESGWYGCVRTVLGWFLDAAGIEATQGETMVEHAVGGRFSSWVEPEPQVVVSVAEGLAERVAGGHA